MKTRKFPYATECGRCLLFALFLIFAVVSANVLGQDPDKAALAAAQAAAAPAIAAAPVTYNPDLSDTPFGDGGGTQGEAAGGTNGDSAQWDYYRFCANAGDTITIETHRTTSAMDPAQMICQGTTDDSTGLTGFFANSCGPDMVFVATDDDNNGIPHNVGGFFTDPLSVFIAPATDEYTLAVWDFIGAGPAPFLYEIHVDGVVSCALNKEITSGPDEDQVNGIDAVVPVKPDEALNYDFTITYDNPDGPPVLVVDTLPAEWIANMVEGLAVDVDKCGEFAKADGNHGMVDIYKNGKPGKKCQSATVIEWMPADSEDATLTKGPDVGRFWVPLGNNGGTYVYANSFVALDDGYPVELGMWLEEEIAPAPSVRFEIWGDTGGAGPDPFGVLATTGSFLPGADATLSFYSSSVLPGAAFLTSGSTYWFAATVVGEPFATGYYRVGGHTQNSVYPDNGTFWYSNDPAGIVFDGQNGTPEMAFEVSTEGTPTLNVDSDTRPSPGKGHGRKGETVFAPTSCGALYLNDGAIAFETDEFGELVLDPQGNPVVVAGPTPPLCLAAVRQDLLDALPEYDAAADHDGDGAASHAEACEIGTNPCDPDTDNDGVPDGADECPLEGPPNAALGQLLGGAGCIFQSQCSDTLDNDSDNVTDFGGGDPSCDDIIDNTEDNDDEDGDGLLDGDEITNGTDPLSPTSVLYEDSGGGFTCVAGVNNTGGTVYGYADYTNTAGTLTVDVILFGANASDNYDIWVNQANSGNEGDPNDDCPTVITAPAVATDGSGDGTGSVSEAVNGSSDVVWISAVGTGAPVLLRSTAQPIPAP